MIWLKPAPLLVQNGGIELTGLTETALRSQHVRDMETQVQPLRVLLAKSLGPEVVEPVGEVEALFEVAELPQVPQPVDQQLASPLLIAFFRPGRNEMRPDQVVALPVLRVVRLPPPRAGADQHVMYLMARGLLLLVGHLGPDHRLDEAVDLQGVTARIDLDERKPADFPDFLTQDEFLAEQRVEGNEVADHLIAVEQRH